MATTPSSSPLRSSNSPEPKPLPASHEPSSRTTIDSLVTPPTSPQTNGSTISTTAPRPNLYQQFVIEPHLNQTRRVLLQPGAWADPIHCELEVVSLDDDKYFEAISYVWGDSPERREIKVNDEPFRITVNLETALRRFRHKNETRYLWADGISINQLDISELNQQVALMRSIYQHCKGVLIYLGEIPSTAATLSSTEPFIWTTQFDETLVPVSKEDTQKIQKFQETYFHHYRLPEALRHNVEQNFELGAFCLISHLAQNKHFNNEDIPYMLAHQGRAKILSTLRHMMQLPWWRRQWVIQETVLAPVATVYYGNIQVPWEMLTAAAKNYLYHRHHCCADQYASLPPEDIQGIEFFTYTHQDVGNWRTIWLQGEGDPRVALLPLLWQFRGREVNNPRDKIFALLPLVTKRGTAGVITPRYDWRVSWVYREIVIEMIKVDNTLLVLMGNTEKSDKLKDELPSWVPDWTAKPHPKELERLDRAQLYRAYKSRPKEKICRFPTEKILVVYGVQHQKVTSVGCLKDSKDGDGDAAVFQEWHALAGLDQPPSTPYVAGGTLRAAYWRTLCMDTKYDGENSDSDNLPMQRNVYERAPRNYGTEYDEVWLQDTSNDDDPDEDGIVTLGQKRKLGQRAQTFAHVNTEPEGRRPAFDDRAPAAGNPSPKNDAVATDIAVKSATAYRRLFRTEDGFLGLGPAGMKVDDIVVVLRGGFMPFLLRDAGNIAGQEQKCFELVGECYLDGIMDGQAWVEPVQEIFLV